LAPALVLLTAKHLGWLLCCSSRFNAAHHTFSKGLEPRLRYIWVIHAALYSSN
jgi:hypothetical protein